MNIFKICSALILSAVLFSNASAQDKATADKAYDTGINPKALVMQRADPSVLKANGRYYFVATAPEYDRIELRSSKTLKGLTKAKSDIIWRKHEKGPMSAHIWAPELIQMDGVWYIYFSAGNAEDIWRIRVYVLANKSKDPTKGTWEELGPVSIKNQTFSLDATIFEHKGEKYYLWAQQDVERTYNTALLIAKLESPTKLGPVETILTKPELPWEVLGYKVNEGPAVLHRNNKIFITYSASATDDRYAMGLLWADENSDLLDPKSWSKMPDPVFYTNEALKRYGPGHNSFTKSENGKHDIMVYHARDYKKLRGTPLSDPNRHTYIKRVKWKKDGFPDFGQETGND